MSSTVTEIEDVPIQPGSLLSLDDAAQVFGVSRIVIARRVETNRLPAVKVGSAWVVSRGAVARMIEQAATDPKRRDRVLGALAEHGHKHYMAWDEELGRVVSTGPVPDRV